MQRVLADPKIGVSLLRMRTVVADPPVSAETALADPDLDHVAFLKGFVLRGVHCEGELFAVCLDDDVVRGTAGGADDHPTALPVTADRRGVGCLLGLLVG